MKKIILHTPIEGRDSETTTEYDVEKITGVKSVSGDETRIGTHFYLVDSPERQFCLEPARQLREMIEKAKNMEEVNLGAEAVNLLLRATKADDGLIFADADDGLFVVVDEKLGPFKGRDRSRYEYARDQLKSLDFIIIETDSFCHFCRITERGYAMGELLSAANHPNQPFRGYVKLPPIPSGTSPAKVVTINQNNFNGGDVNNRFRTD